MSLGPRLATDELPGGQIASIERYVSRAVQERTLAVQVRARNRKGLRHRPGRPL